MYCKKLMKMYNFCRLFSIHYSHSSLNIKFRQILYSIEEVPIPYSLGI